MTALPLAFAHRGAPAPGTRENTLPAFRAALAAGVPGLESDVWLTADGVPVLVHDGFLRRFGVLRQPLRTLPRAVLPSWIPSLDELYAACGTGFELSLDLKDPGAAAAVLDVARAADSGAPRRLWLCGSVRHATTWRRGLGDVPHLVNSVRARDVAEGVPARARALRGAGVDVLNMHCSDWSRSALDAVKDAGRLAFGWDAQTPTALDALLSMGCDGVYSDSAAELLAALSRLPDGASS